MPAHHLSEQDCRDILRRAAELQGIENQPPETHLTSEELLTAAREIGIEERFISQAISERNTRLPQHQPNIFGGPGQHHLEINLARPLTDDEWEDTIAELRTFARSPGKSETRGTTREWSANNGNVETYALTVRSTPTRTFATLSSDRSGLTVVFHLLFTLLPTFISVGASHSLPASNQTTHALFIGTAFALFFLITRSMITRNAKTTRNQLQQLLQNLQQRTITISTEHSLDLSETDTTSALERNSDQINRQS